VTSITPTPATQNASASYSVKFTTGSLGALSAGDSIRVVFPQNTYLPPTLSASNVTVNGLNPSVNPTVQGDTLTIPAPATINGLTPVTVLINQIAGILNPTLAKGYTLKVITSAEAGPFTSPNYNITATTSTVSAATVTPVPYRPGLAAKYTIDFNVGTNGRLLPGTSTITVTFNSSTTVSTVPANYDSTYIVVDGVGTQITTIQIAGRAITMTVPSGVNIHNNDAASIILNRTGATKPITNPVSTGNYTLQVRTSVETSNITSNTYSITTANAVTGIRMVLADNIVNSESANTISFRVQNQITSPGGTVTITFPYNTFIPVTIAATRVSVAHNATNPTVFANASLVLTNPATRTVTVTVPATIPANDSVRVAIAATAGIQNPSIAGSNYNVQVKTTSQNINGTSAAYTLAPTSTTILNLGVVIDPITPSVNGEYTFTFQTGSRGRLVSGTSMIYLLLPDDATFTQGVPAVSKVTVNGAQADAVDLLPRTGTNPDTLIVTVPTSVTIGNMTNVTVLIDVTAGLRNASTTASRRYEAFTSVETGSVWLDASLPVELTHFACESRSGKVYLDWTTESEVENAYWMIQRKKLTDVEAAAWKAGILQNVDGESSFETIDHVDGKGSISIQTRYTFVDSIVEVGSVYAYRLADVSYNGTVTYHEAVYQEVKAPLEFKLYKNFPNPFNPSTTIRYSLPMDSRVELKVFNILGQVVTTLTDDMLAAGYHTIQWNGINRVGSQVASGTYFLYFSAKSVNSNQQFTKVMKILLLR
ncbi:MAG: T9SS type A sorting domain-containing protein, partial [Calditrichales bacterium]